MLDVAQLTDSEKKISGAHYTPEGLADFVAEQIIGCGLNKCPRILDPSMGDGELLLAILRKLSGKAEIHGFDTDQNAVSLGRKRLLDAFPSTSVDAALQDFLSIALDHRDGGLFAPEDKYDVVIANPPYVRTQVMGADRSQELARDFVLNGRVDLYFAFIEGIAEVLRTGGVAGIIVSNRFMTTKAGGTVRKRILENFDILHVWDMGDTRLFEAAVLPAVLLLQKKSKTAFSAAPLFSSIYTTSDPATDVAATVIDALAKSGVLSVNGTAFKVQHGTLNHSPGDAGVWRIATELGDEWLDTVRKNSFCTFGDIGKIRVGVKSTADKVFIRKSWPATARPELLRPLITHHVARRYKSAPANREILYTHESNGTKKIAVDLSKYPISQKYLEDHRDVLEKRTYVTKSGRNWFEIWVPQNPSLWAVPKLVFPDISEKPMFWMSLDGEIINGDCYWLAAAPDQIDLLWLALAVANSTFSEAFYDHAFNNKLYAGRRRFMTQYVEKFPIPNPASPTAKEIVKLVKNIYGVESDEEIAPLAEQLDSLVHTAFGLSKKSDGIRI